MKHTENVNAESKRIAESIEAILKQRNLTHSDFARLVGKRESEISRWMSGHHNFTISTLVKIESALKVKLIDRAYSSSSSTLVSEPAAEYYTPNSIRDICIGLLNKISDTDVLLKIRSSIENLVSIEDRKAAEQIRISDFINSIPLEGGSLVPANIKGAGCLVEEKYL